MHVRANVLAQVHLVHCYASYRIYLAFIHLHEGPSGTNFTACERHRITEACKQLLCICAIKIWYAMQTDIE